MKCHLTCVFVIALNANAAQSLLTFHHPKLIRPSPLRRQVGLSHEPHPHDDIIQDTSRNNEASPISLSAFEKVWRTYAMIAYVAHMCVAIPLALLPTYVKMRLELSPKTELEHEALQVGQACARTLLEMIPFMNLTVTPHASTIENPTATIWVANHVSMLDTFVFLAADEKLRGKHRRPVKVLYWKGLDANPICKILFSMAGFIPVNMENNGNGNPNQYHPGSFKKMMKSAKQAIVDGFDLLIYPEGQLNPTPLAGLQPVFPGAFSLAKSSSRPIQMIALHGTHNLWHADENIGMTVVDKDVTIQAYPPLKKCDSYEDFHDAFSNVVGTFGSTGHDIPDKELAKWIDL